jgi:hypothetical protein
LGLSKCHIVPRYHIAFYFPGKPDSAGSQPHPQSTSLVFKKLPTELFQLIATFLPLSAAVSLTLTCRQASVILRGRYLDRINKKGCPEKLEFVQLLERDLPRHILCAECELLHSRKQLQNPPSITPCEIADRSFYLSLYIQPQFDSITFLLAMKLHRHGLDSSKLLSHFTGSGTIRRITHIQHWKSQPRIVNGHYLLRHQTRLLLRAPPPYEIDFDIINLRVCPDWYSGYFYIAKMVRQHPNYRPEVDGPPRLVRMLACRISHLDNAELNSSCSTCAGLIRCKNCPTEFQVDVKNVNEQGVALVITRWLDLGEGRDLQDERFRSHLSCYKGQPVRPGAGSIKGAYEGRHFEMEELLTRGIKRR